ncbi:response regulator transcription factor [Chloroflexota bacterium]
MDKDIHILVVDDHQVVREGLRRLLEDEEDMELIGQGANSEEALFQIEMLSPDVVLMDIKMPGVDGVELTRQVKQKYPSCNVIMLTLYDEYLNEAMAAGANGYLLKDIKREELAESIRRVYHGEVVLSEGIKSKARTDYTEKYGITEEDPDNIFEEVQLMLPPPVEANQLMRFATEVEDMLQSRVLQVVGSWQEGTAMTIILTNAAKLADILRKLEQIPEIEAVAEEPMTAVLSDKLIKKASAIPRLRDKPRKTIFVTLGQN